MRQSIELQEKEGNSNLDLSLFDQLVNLDLEAEGVDTLTEEEENDFFALLQSENVGKAITNLAEHLLMTEAMSGRIKVSSVAISWSEVC